MSYPTQNGVTHTDSHCVRAWEAAIRFVWPTEGFYVTAVNEAVDSESLAPETDDAYESVKVASRQFVFDHGADGIG